LLAAVLIWSNFQVLLYGKTTHDSLGSSFITISKKVTQENMGKPRLTTFNRQEITAIRQAPQVQDAGVFSSNKFPAYIRLDYVVGFSTDIFLESVPHQFMDTIPANWIWEKGSREVPIILSTEFLNLYNYGFALSRGLPQLSKATIQTLVFDLVVGPPEKKRVFAAKVAGFSDRISSVLVPQNFMEFANKEFAATTDITISRLILKVKDPSDPSFIDFLSKNNYETNTENLRWNKLRSIIEIIVMATGALALLLIGICTLVFILFIELAIARAKQSLELLNQTGYAPSFLRKYMAKKFLPLMIWAVGLAVFATCLLQYFVAQKATGLSLSLPELPGIYYWITTGLCFALMFIQIKKSIAKAIA